MDGSRPQPGQRVRVVLEGEVLESAARGFIDLNLAEPLAPGRYLSIPDDHPGLEVLPDPDPPWWPPQPGDVVRVWNSVYLREHNLPADDMDGELRLWVNAGGARMPDDDLLRLHTADDTARPELLVRGGEPYDEEAERTSDGFASGRYSTGLITEVSRETPPGPYAKSVQRTVAVGVVDLRVVLNRLASVDVATPEYPADEVDRLWQAIHHRARS